MTANKPKSCGFKTKGKKTTNKSYKLIYSSVDDLSFGTDSANTDVSQNNSSHGRSEPLDNNSSFEKVVANVNSSLLDMNNDNLKNCSANATSDNTVGEIPGCLEKACNENSTHLENQCEEVESSHEPTGGATAISTGRNHKVEWLEEIEFTSRTSLNEYISNKQVVKQSCNKTSDGIVSYYRCALVPKRQAYSCPVKLKVFEYNRNTSFSVSRTNAEHDHSKIKQKAAKLSSELREYIFDLKHESGMKPRKIREHLQKHRSNEPTPNVRQVRYAITKGEKANIKPTFSFGELAEWIKSEMTVPKDIDSAFILDYMYDRTDSSFAFVVSTPRLLCNLTNQTNICADGTYKITWQGYPLIVVGTIDRQKHFHVVAICLTSNERQSEYSFVFETIRKGFKEQTKTDFRPNLLISDAAPAIRNAFYGTFESAAENVICSVHVYRNLRETSCYQEKQNKKLIKNDIHIVQSSPSHSSFEHAVLLFLEKWENPEPDFCEYFKRTWLREDTQNWYTGYSPYIPSHNNAQVI